MEESKEPRKGRTGRQKVYHRNVDGTFACCEDLEQRQRDLIIELLSNGGHKTAAREKLGIPKTTMYDWFNSEKFMKAYRKACEKLYQDGLTDAITTVIKLMKGKDSRTALKAAENVMKLNGLLLDTKSNEGEKTTEIHITLEDNRE